MRPQDYVYLKQCYLHDNPVPTWEQRVHEHKYKCSQLGTECSRGIHCRITNRNYQQTFI